MNWRNLILLLSILLVLCTAGSLLVGAYDLSFPAFRRALTGGSEEPGGAMAHFLLFQIRLPRILLAGLTGAGLAVAGAAIQGLFRNPLADTTLIGINSGAMLFAAGGIVFMGSLLAPLAKVYQQSVVAFAAFIGGVLTTYIVYFLSYRRGKVYVMTMLLAGIAISALAAAATGLMIYLSDDQQLRDITFWSMGSIGGATWTQVLLCAPVVVLSIALLQRHARALNAILLGEKEAAYLGVRVEKLKNRIITLSALVVGVCISMTGLIGFVGLIVPHFLRLIRGTDYRYLMPASALVGAAFLITADAMARTLIAPAELPIGILTAMVGAPFFLWLLLRAQQEKMML